MLHVFKVTDERLLVDGSPSDIRTRYGKTYYVNANTTFDTDVNPFPGVDTHSGLSWSKAFATMSKAFTSLASGDTIIFRGKVREQLTTPVNIFDVSVIGIGNRPHHADSTPTGGQYAQATWTTPASGATTAPLVDVLQQGWRFENILFAGPSDHTCIRLFRNDGAADAERDASHAVIRNCRFASGQDGIYLVEVSNVLIEKNVFGSGVGGGMTGYDIKHVTGSGIANPLTAEIRDNKFFGSANHIYASLNNALITGNFFDDGGTPTTTVVLNTNGAGLNGAGNFVVRNYFQTTTANFNSPDVVGTTTDVWVENYSFDSTSAGVGSNFEAGNPA